MHTISSSSRKVQAKKKSFFLNVHKNASPVGRRQLLNISHLNMFKKYSASDAGVLVFSMPVDSTSELLKHYELYETIGSGNVPQLFVYLFLRLWRLCI